MGRTCGRCSSTWCLFVLVEYNAYQNRNSVSATQTPLCTWAGRGGHGGTPQVRTIRELPGIPGFSRSPSHLGAQRSPSVPCPASPAPQPQPRPEERQRNFPAGERKGLKLQTFLNFPKLSSAPSSPLSVRRWGSEAN